MQKSTTYFAQIPVELVKKIAKLDASGGNGEKDAADTTLGTRALKLHRLPSLGNNGLTLQLSEQTKTDEDSRYAEWRESYQQALLELDQDKLRDHIAAAETAISNRLRAIAGDSNHHAERQAINDALSSLRVLKRHNL